MANASASADSSAADSKFRHRAWPLFQLGQSMIIDLSRVLQWKLMYDKKYIVAPQRYGVARFVMETMINGKKYWVLTLYSSAHVAYTMTLPIPAEFWDISAAPAPFNERKTLFLAHLQPELYDMGRVISVEFLHEPQKALKRLRDLAGEPHLLVVPTSQLAPLPVDVHLAAVDTPPSYPYPSIPAAEQS